MVEKFVASSKPTTTELILSKVKKREKKKERRRNEERERERERESSKIVQKLK